MSGDLVHLQRVRFRGGRRWPDPGVVLAVPPLPRSTMDPRYRFCHEHRTACDCREAELAEQLNERWIYLRDIRDAAQRVLAGHRLLHYAEEEELRHLPREARNKQRWGNGPLACQCTGCQIIRAADIKPHTDWETGVVTDPSDAAS